MSIKTGTAVPKNRTASHRQTSLRIAAMLLGTSMLAVAVIVLRRVRL